MNKQRCEINMIKRFFWSSLSLPAYGQVGQGQHSLAAHFALRNTKFGGGKKLETESEGGQKFLPPNPFLFARPSGKVLIKIQNLDFRQKKFEHQSKNTAKIRNQKKRTKRGRAKGATPFRLPIPIFNFGGGYRI